MSVYINVKFQSHKSIVNIIHEKYKYIYYLIDRLVWLEKSKISIGESGNRHNNMKGEGFFPALCLVVPLPFHEVIYAGMDVVKDADCNDASANAGELVLWSCKLDDATSSLTAAGAFSAVSHLGYCLAADSEMYLCKESVQ